MCLVANIKLLVHSEVDWRYGFDHIHFHVPIIIKRTLRELNPLKIIVEEIWLKQEQLNTNSLCHLLLRHSHKWCVDLDRNRTLLHKINTNTMTRNSSWILRSLTIERLFWKWIEQISYYMHSFNSSSFLVWIAWRLFKNWSKGKKKEIKHGIWYENYPNID